MRPQDVVILLKRVSAASRSITNSQMAKELGISASEVSESLERSRIARLIDSRKQRVNILALQEFMVHGLKYIFPAYPQSKVRGIATAISAPPMNQLIQSGKEVYVWQDSKGDLRGESITPLYKTVPMAVKEDTTLYKLLALTDVFRMGRAREIEIAKKELSAILSKYGEQ